MKVFRFAAQLESDSPEVAALWDLGCQGMQQEGDLVAAWFEREVALPLEGVWSEPEDVDWVARFHETLDPVELSLLVIAPTHREVVLRAGQQVMWLDPGMAFGTGHHATTRMALEALERSSLQGKRILDVGAGTGILAVAADLLGAAATWGVDTDALTLPVARELAERNRVRTVFEHGSLRPEDPSHQCDVLVANLYAEAHVSLASAYASALAPNGRLVVTGILEEKVDAVRSALEEVGFTHFEQRTESPWCLVEARSS